MRRNPKRHGLQMEHDVPLSAPVNRPPMPPRHKPEIVEPDSGLSSHAPDSSTVQSTVPMPSRHRSTQGAAGMTQEWVRLSDCEPWMPPGTIGVYLSDIGTGVRALLGYFTPGELKDVCDTVAVEGIHGKESAIVYDGTFFVDGDLAGFEIVYEAE